MYHIYTFGKKSKQFLILTPKQAQTMNDFTECFINAQEKFFEKNGYRWDPIVDPTIALFIPDDDPELVDRYNKLVSFCNRQHSLRNRLFDLLRIDVSKEDIDGYLVKRF